MLYQILDGTVTVGGEKVLSHIDFEIRGNEKIAVVGKNGAGKTTLLRLIAGELSLDRDDRRPGPGITSSRRLTVGLLAQQSVFTDSITVEEALSGACPFPDTGSRERFEYEREYDRLFTGFGFAKGDKKRLLPSFSGGEQTKLRLIRLLLEKPDILLLDEPTNHLDVETVQWLEQYMVKYEKAVVTVSHDRFFLDQTADVVYELADKRLTRYPGSYTHYREEKLKRIRLQRKAYERQQEELKRLEGVVERFKHKPSKAAFARAKRKQMERMERVEKPEEDDVHLFTGEISPLIGGSKWVFEAEHLKLGYDRQLLEISLRLRRGQKIGLLGPNGTGKTTFLKTIAGLTPPYGGDYTLGSNVTIGYFDQHSAEIQSDKTLARHFHDLFPGMTEKEVRSILGAYLFAGKEASKKVSSLSGGEKARLVLAELLTSRPNFLVLDEPTNHMDIQAMETLESAFKAYTGTILFVSHDRYFIRQVADSVLIFENQSVMYYPFGYEHYLERVRREAAGESIAAQITARQQALVAGLKAVPKAERHRLREISTEEAYKDWRLRLVTEKMIPAGEAVGRLEAELEEKQARWMESWQCGEEAEELQGGEAGSRPERAVSRPREQAVSDALIRLNAARLHWHQLCLEWQDIYNEQ